MKHLLSFFIAALISIIVSAQSAKYPCQVVNAVLDNSIQFPAVNSTNRLVISVGDTITFAALGNGPAVFPQNDIFYHQDSSNVLFIWVFNGVESDTGQVIERDFPHKGVYSVEYHAIDSNLCESSILEFEVLVLENTPIESNFSQISHCVSDILYLTVGETQNKDIVISPNVFSLNNDTLRFVNSSTYFIPDGPYCPPGYLDIRVNVSYPYSNLAGVQATLFEVGMMLEHSFSGDLGFIVYTPLGMSLVMDFNDHGGGAYLGTSNLSDGANKCDSITNPPGTGYLYAWSSVYALNTMNFYDGLTSPMTASDTSIHTNMLLPENGSFASITNNADSFNGEWNIRVIDDFGIDNGYCFGTYLKIIYNVDAALPLVYHYTDTLSSGNGISWVNDSVIAINPPGAGVYSYSISVFDSIGLLYEYHFDVDFINDDQIVGNSTPNVNQTEIYAVDSMSNAVYFWTVQNGTLTNGQGSSQVSVLWDNSGSGFVSVDEIAGSCSFSDTLFVDITAIDDYELEKCLIVYPNPASEIIDVYFETNANETFSANIVSVDGNVLKSFYINGYHTFVNVSDLAAGVYFIQLPLLNVHESLVIER